MQCRGEKCFAPTADAIVRRTIAYLMILYRVGHSDPAVALRFAPPTVMHISSLAGL
ncbi:MAG: hypothetical protein LBU34_10380 [Planctomycetaceae bacterium]|nr:hypothetical protein [Planctomycetaceae bacterium]